MEDLYNRLRRYRWFLLSGALVLILTAGLLAYNNSQNRPQQPAAPAPEMPVQTYQAPRGLSRSDDVDLLASVINAEAGNEPYTGQVAIGAVILNRMQHPSFPQTLAGVIYQPHAFESVSTGYIWTAPQMPSSRQAAIDALNGWDPTYGSLYFWNPSKPVSSWIWTRQIITQIGKHVFAL